MPVAITYDVAADGTLSPKSPAEVPAAPNPQFVAVSPDGKSAYVPEFALNRVYQFDIAADGTLSPKTPATVGGGGNPSMAAVAADGKSVYVTNTGGNSVSQYDVASDGTLSPKSVPTVGAGQSPFAVVANPDGKSLYVTNSGSGSVSQYDVGAGGALVPKSTASVPAGGYPVGAAISSDGASLYAANELDGTVSQYDVGAGGALTPKDPASVPAGSFSFGVAVTPSKNQPPDCTRVSASPSLVFSAVRGFATVKLTGASDPDGDALRFHIDRVAQDEPVTSSGDVTSPDARLTAAGADSDRVELRAESNPRRDGRVYRIAYTVSDGNGGQCSRSLAHTNAKPSVPRAGTLHAIDSAPPSWDSFSGAQLP